MARRKGGEQMTTIRELISNWGPAARIDMYMERQGGRDVSSSELLVCGLFMDIVEAHDELSTYLVGTHFGFDFGEDSAAYIKGWLDNAKSQGKNLGKENLDRVMNSARWLINEVSSRLS